MTIKDHLNHPWTIEPCHQHADCIHVRHEAFNSPDAAAATDAPTAVDEIHIPAQIGVQFSRAMLAATARVSAAKRPLSPPVPAEVHDAPRT